jgi:hypothetical protein
MILVESDVLAQTVTECPLGLLQAHRREIDPHKATPDHQQLGQGVMALFH